MKKTSWLLILLAVLAFGMVPGMAGAQAQYLSIDQLGCNVLDVDGLSIISIATSKTHIVQTFSSNNNVNATCHAYITVPPDLNNAKVFQARNFPDLKCYIFTSGGSVSTGNWHQVITPSGNLTLTCHFKGTDIPR